MTISDIRTRIAEIRAAAESQRIYLDATRYVEDRDDEKLQQLREALLIDVLKAIAETHHSLLAVPLARAALEVLEIEGKGETQ